MDGMKCLVGVILCGGLLYLHPIVLIGTGKPGKMEVSSW